MSGGGSGSQTTTVDPVYNQGLLNIYNQNQKYADTFMNMFRYGVDYNPNEKVTGKTIDGKWYSKDELKKRGIDDSAGYMTENPEWTKWNSGRKTGISLYGGQYGESDSATPEPQRYITNDSSLEQKTLGEIKGYDPKAQTSEMEYLQNVVQSNQELLGLQTSTSQKELQLASATADANKSLLPLQTQASKKQARFAGEKYDAASKFLKEVNKGIDIPGRMNEAQAEVQHGFQLAGEAERMDIASFGLDPNAGRYASQNRNTALAEASGIAGARTTAKRTAEEEDFNRKLRGLQIA